IQPATFLLRLKSFSRWLYARARWRDRDRCPVGWHLQPYKLSYFPCSWKSYAALVIVSLTNNSMQLEQNSRVSGLRAKAILTSHQYICAVTLQARFRTCTACADTTSRGHCGSDPIFHGV